MNLQWLEVIETVTLWESDNTLVQIGIAIGFIALLTILTHRNKPAYSISGENKADWVYTGP